MQQLLTDGLPVWDARITPERISVNRAIPLSPKKLPAVLIYSRDEKIDKEPNADPGLRRHMLELAVEVVGGGAKNSHDVFLLCSPAEQSNSLKARDKKLQGTTVNAQFTYVTIKEAAIRLGLKSQRYLNNLCLAGKIEGAVKPGNEWLVPIQWVDKRLTIILQSKKNERQHY